MADAIGQTITVVNKSGKVVSTSKHLVNIFKEARAAYRERKAEIQAERTGDVEKKKPVKSAETTPTRPRSPTTPTNDLPIRTHAAKSVHASSRSNPSSKHSSRRSPPEDFRHSQSRSHRTDSHRSDGHRRSKPPTERGYSDSFYADHRPRRVRTDRPPKSPLRFMDEANQESKGKELVRRHSYADAETMRRSSTALSRRNSGIDMDLAYGELPPPLPTKTREEEEELRTKVTSLQRVLEEAQCLHHSATAMIKNLEKNPEAMAAVGLTLAEISGLVTKLGPGALTALKASFPAVVALLVSPEFLIAAGVGVGITVVAFGGYKIVKKIRAKKEAEKAANSPQELEELNSDVDLNSIDSWRRGIADVESASVGTSVEGEYITPAAAAQLRQQGRLAAAPEKSGKKKEESEKDAKKKKEKEEKKAKEAKAKEEKADKKKQKAEKEASDKAEKKAKKEQVAREKKKAEDDMLL